MIIIGRYVDGIIMNTLEYLLDENNNLLKFIDETSAEHFLREHGFTDDDISWTIFVTVD
jgi:hypothetical protein